MELLLQRIRQGLTAAQHAAQRTALRQIGGVQENLQHRRHEVHGRDA
ncbi:hypothetical protein LP419_12950 [Massilia sp. H-1]|nr:hypothetical protein LP419_12950 [Massilia sp. H-1]